jgi:tRNA A-37 threonylcarbamoyl transferase component Bud32/tetratricopeptide (TPR) repeat protein
VSCPDDATLVELVDGRLEADAVAALDGHLDSCDECRQVVTALSGGATTTGSELARGGTLGRYLIVDVLGTGAMGLVYEAYDPSLHRRVAIKVLRAEAAVPTDRLVHEARALARLTHPNVVTVYEVGESDHGVFVAMELVDGESLRTWMRGRSWREVCEVFAQAAAGLAAAHAADLVHRDVKPDNIIVGADGRVRVTDFGLARAGESDEAATLEDAVALDRTISRTGAVVGTPAYMAPEQLRGEAADAASDQFGLCVAMYEALFARRPFDGADLPALRAQVLAAEPRPAPRGAVPRWLDAVVRRGLSRDPAERFESLSALGAELRRDRRGRRRALLGAGAGLVVAASLGFALFGGGSTASVADPCGGSEQAFAQVWSPQRHAAVIARLDGGDGQAPLVAAGIDRWSGAWAAGHRAACRATRVSGEQSEVVLDGRMRCLRGHLRQLEAFGAAVEAGDAPTLARAAEVIASLPDVADCADVDALSQVAPPPAGREPELDGVAAELARARLATTTGDVAGGDRIAGAALARALALGYLPLVAEARLVGAELRRRLGDVDAAAALADDALLAATEARDDVRVARAWLALATIEGSRGYYDRALAHARHARAAVARIDAGPAVRATLHNVVGALLLEQGTLEAARTELDAALTLRREHDGEHSVGTAVTLTNLGNLARAEGRLDDALVLHRRAMAADSAVLGAAHPNRATHLHNLGGVLRLQRQFAAARAAYDEALAIKRARLGDQHPEVALTENSLGVLAETEGDRAAAAQHYRTALNLFEAAGDARARTAEANLTRAELPRRPRAKPRPEVPPAVASGARPELPPGVTPPEAPAKVPEPPRGSYLSGPGWDSP